MHLHLVFVTQYCPAVLSERAIQDLRQIFTDVCEHFETQLIECDGEDEHVHLLVNYPPNVALAKPVNCLQTGQLLKGCIQPALAEYST